jgi:hypothetical protein
MAVKVIAMSSNTPPIEWVARKWGKPAPLSVAPSFVVAIGLTDCADCVQFSGFMGIASQADRPANCLDGWDR